MTEAWSADDHRHMARAIQLAWRGLYTTDPNPRVGCVLVRQGRIVGAGWHRKAGEAHAERIALAQAGPLAKGATAYVTLEPCCHHGKTPPCTYGLKEAGVRRVVAAMTDPNPLVAGKGLQWLQEQGLEVSVGLLRAEAEKLNPGFIKRMSQGLPWVRCKLAMSLDGRTAMANGESQWITGEAAREDVHRLRARSSAILTGIGTVLADDPSLNVRLSPERLPGVGEAHYFRAPSRIILDSKLRISEQARIFSVPGAVWVLHVSGRAEKVQRLEARGIGVKRFPEGLAWPAILRFLAAQEYNEILIEAGPTVAGSALREGWIDELWIYMAAHVMGDAARGLFHLPGLETMAQRIPLRLYEVRQIGDDLRLQYHLE